MPGGCSCAWEGGVPACSWDAWIQSCGWAAAAVPGEHEAPALSVWKGVGIPPVPASCQLRGARGPGHASPAVADVMAVAAPRQAAIAINLTFR